MLEWSRYFQTPRYLDLYRKMTMVNEFKPVIAKWINLKNNMTILDVGCGTGAFCFYLSTETQNTTFFGIDIDENFISVAKQKATENMLSNIFDFKVGDALELPFQDNFFDIVISYTVFTNIPNGKKAIDEMVRVVKPGGKIVSVTTQSLQYVPSFDGNYPHSFNNYYPEYKFYKSKISQFYETVQPCGEYLQYGTIPEKVPLLFANSSLKNIEMHPLGYSFSLSNAIYTLEEKKKFIDEMYMSEFEKFHNYIQLPIAKNFISEKEINKYDELLKKHHDMLLNTINENNIWEWFGGAQILMCGEKYQ